MFLTPGGLSNKLQQQSWLEAEYGDWYIASLSFECVQELGH